jgi:hypothetical protein
MEITGLGIKKRHNYMLSLRNLLIGQRKDSLANTKPKKVGVAIFSEWRAT